MEHIFLNMGIFYNIALKWIYLFIFSILESVSLYLCISFEMGKNYVTNSYCFKRIQNEEQNLKAKIYFK